MQKSESAVARVVMGRLSISIIRGTSFSSMGLVTIAGSVAGAVCVGSPVPVLRFSLISVGKQVVGGARKLRDMSCALSCSSYVNKACVMRIIASTKVDDAGMVVGWAEWGLI